MRFPSKTVSVLIACMLRGGLAQHQLDGDLSGCSGAEEVEGDPEEADRMHLHRSTLYIERYKY